MHASIRAKRARKHVINSSRRLGKSYLMCAMATEDALTIPDGQIRFAAPTQKALRKITLPLFRDLLRDCPSHLRPWFRTTENVLWFPSTNAEIHLSGANHGYCENLRGTTAHRCYIDEAGFVDELRYLIDDILMPQMLTTDGDLVIASTPPPTPAHAFAEYCMEARMAGAYSEFDIFSSGYAHDLIEAFCREAGGPDATTWKREYLCQFVVDSNYAIIPEWNDAYIAEPVRDEFHRYYLRYSSMDIGVEDFTVVLWGHYDFKRAILYVEDEFVINGPAMTTDRLADGIRDIEAGLYPDGRMTTRVADNNNLLLLNDLSRLHQMHYAPTTKDTLQAMVNQTRMFVANQRLRVSPKCKNLIGCLKAGIWKQSRKEFDRVAGLGHVDALAALIYMIRNLDEQTNPVPATYMMTDATHYIPEGFGDMKISEDMRRMLGIRKVSNG